MKVRNVAHVVTTLSVELRETHRVLHVRVDEDDLETARLEWGSDYILNQVTEQALKDERQQLEQLLRPISLGLVDGVGDIRGGMWEIWAHVKIQEGGTFRVRVACGSSPPADTLTIAPSPDIFVFRSLDRVRHQPDGIYCKPKQRNWPSIDSLQQPQWLYQMTINPDKRVVKGQGLQDAICALKCDSQHVRYIVVVPPMLYQSFGPLQVKATGHVNATVAAELQERTTQWIMEVK